VETISALKNKKTNRFPTPNFRIFRLSAINAREKRRDCVPHGKSQRRNWSFAMLGMMTIEAQRGKMRIPKEGEYSIRAAPSQISKTYFHFAKDAR
jgi:hypothetical protein